MTANNCFYMNPLMQKVQTLVVILLNKNVGISSKTIPINATGDHSNHKAYCANSYKPTLLYLSP